MLTRVRHFSALLTLSLVCLVPFGSTTQAADLPTPLSYPYRESGTFSEFVRDSFRIAKAKQPNVAARSFFQYMGTAIPESMDAARLQLRGVKKNTDRARIERNICANLHKAIKKQIPKFSLDRGFEFYNTVKLGERQCFLQSVVIAGLLQRAGIPTGVVMVSRNEKGAHCNNGHAVAVAHLSNGNDILVDASDPTPFMEHQGLMMRQSSTAAYVYVEPVYNATRQITGYRNLRTHQTMQPSAVTPLDTTFLNSQFDYYRGERTPGGLFTPPLAKPAGLAQSEKWLQKSVTECPKNPLAVYMLGKIQERQGKLLQARRAYTDAYALYSHYGWIPDEETRSLVAIKRKTSQVATAP